MVQTKEEKAIKRKARDEKNKEKIAVKAKANYEKNKDERLAKQKAKAKTPEGKKSNRIGKWKQSGIIYDQTNDEVYNWFMNIKECMACFVKLIDGLKGNSRCLDHNHNIKDAENIRAVLCRNCNSHEGGYVNHGTKEAYKKYRAEKIACKWCGKFVCRPYMTAHQKTQTCKNNKNKN